MLSPIVTPPLDMVLPSGETQAPSHITVPKTQKKRVIRIPIAKKLATKKLKINSPAPIDDLTVEVEQSIPAITIVE